MASADPPKPKKRNPPTFPHHRPEQARKLKAQWIQREKIKSKWRAEKRRDPTLRPPPPQQLPQPEEPAEESEEEEEWSGITQPLPPPKPARPKPVDPEAALAQRLQQRALAREAYSPASLHHHKSRFDHRRSRKQTGAPTSGGQPNMKLRMNALLDRIKRGAE